MTKVRPPLPLRRRQRSFQVGGYLLDELVAPFVRRLSSGDDPGSSGSWAQWRDGHRQSPLAREHLH